MKNSVFYFVQNIVFTIILQIPLRIIRPCPGRYILGRDGYRLMLAKETCSFSSGINSCSPPEIIDDIYLIIIE